jgi:hypothetical protein
MDTSSSKLTDEAYPTIFENQPSYMTVEPAKERKNPSERMERVFQRDENNFIEFLQQDIIENYSRFVDGIKNRNFSPFDVFVKEDYVLFTKICDSKYNDAPIISVSFKISINLDVNVFHKDLCVPIEHFRWILADWLVQWLESLPLDQEVTGSIPGSGLAFFTTQSSPHYLRTTFISLCRHHPG